ncbi:hypothetical protein MKW98_031613 [Papaver atlanticum]|uniref:BRCT domain-containing protein n=1 Tax=Papaver atlanticum TaxID=357466 RepID=A0AAD4X852_9MAGN|nr:hypothetical protein MKW98_031613 [Papaver atlanticum]
MESDNCRSDTLAQFPSSSSSQSVLGGDLSKDDENAEEFGLPNDTVRYEDEEFESQFETQELEDADCHGFAASDGEGTDTTLVLEEDGDNDDECCSGVTPTSFRKRKDIVLDSDTLADKCTSGSVKRSCMSVSNNEAARTVSKNLGDDEEMADTRNPTPVITKFIDDAKSDRSMCNGNMKGGRTVGANSVVKKLSFEDTSNLNNFSFKDNESTDGAQDTTLPVAFNHQLAGLSYLDSEEPGEWTQNNALDIVDKFLSVNDLKMSQEAVPEKASDENNFSVSRTKDTLELAKRINIRSPTRDVSIFDWRDISEDEEAGISSFKRKKKDRNSSCKKKKEALNLGKRMMGVARSDSSLLLDDPKGVSEGIETSESEMNNSFEINKQLDAVIQEKLPEVTGINNDVMDTYDVGFDTQMAAEAMQDLLCGAPASHDSDSSHQLPEKTIVCSPRGDLEIKSCLKHDLVHKKHRSTDRDAAIRQDKKMKIVEAKSRNEISSRTISVKLSGKQRKPASGEKRKAKGNLKREGAYSGTKSTKSAVSKKTVTGQEMRSVKGANSLDNSLESNENLTLNRSLLQEVGTFTPIACRTRRSRAAKPLEGLNLSTSSEEAKYLLSGISHSSGRSPNLRVKSQLPNIKEQSQQNNQDLGGLHEVNDCRWSRRSCSNIAVHLNRDGNLDDQSNLTTGEINFQYIPRRKRSKCRARGSFNSEIKNDTGSTLTPDPSMCSPGKKFGATMVGKSLCQSGLADGAVNCSTTVGNGNLVPKILGRTKSSGDCGKVTEVFISSNENAEQCNTLDAASPDFTQYYCRKNSRKKSLLRPSLAEELTRLDSIEASSNVVKDLRKRRDMASVRVLFSNHLDEDIIKHQQKISRRLGIGIASSSSEATHFIADQFARTRNMLEAIAHGKHVVTHLWLESCEQAGCLIDEKTYILRDPKKEKEIGFSMPVSLARARKSPLLQDKQVFITPNVKPSKQLVSDLAKAVHGQIVEEMGKFAKNSNKISDDLLVFSCEEDHRICMPLVKKGAAIYSSEILLTGIIVQKLEYGRHRLFRDQ